VKNLPEMESKLAFTSEQLKKAEEVLPSSVLIDEVIESVGKNAKEADVFLKNFAPLGEKTIGGDYPYDEIRFKITMGGKFANLTKWMDLLAGSETKGYVKSLEFKRGVSLATRRLIQEMNQPKSAQDGEDEVKKIESAYEKAIKGRDDYALDLVTEVVYYRASTNISSPAGAVDPKAIPPVQTGVSPAAQGSENRMGSVEESTSHNIALGVMQK